MLPNIVWGILLIWLVLACTHGQDPDDQHVVVRSRKLTFAQDIYPVLSPYLVGSGHQTASGGPAELNLINVSTAYSNLVNAQSKINPGMKLVVPGDHANSFLWIKLTGGPKLVGMQMPPANYTTLKPVELAEVKVWIDEGALFQVDAMGISSLPGPNGGVIRGGNVASRLDSTLLSIMGTLAIILATAGYLYIKT